MSNIDKRAQKELYSKVEQQAHSLRGNPREYQALTGMCPVNVIEMQAQKILALLDELEHYKSREERVTKLVLDNSASWDELYKKLEAAEKRSREMAELLINMKKARPGGVYFNKWDAQIDSVLRTAGINVAAAGKGE